MPFNVVLLLVFNYAAHVRLNLPRLRELYEPHFSSIVVYADVPRSPSDAIAGVTYVDIREGLFVHRALADFARTHAANVSRASGAFMVMDDAIINVRALPSGGGGAPWWDGVVFNTDERALRAGGYLSHANGSLPRVTPPERRREWTWDYSPTGNAAIAALRARRGPAAFDDAFCAAFSDYLYMPARMWSPAFADDCAALADVGLSLEIAVPTALRAALLREAAPPRLLAFDAVTLWNDGWRIDRDLVRRGDFLWRALCGGDDGVGDGDRDVGAAPHVPRVLAVHPVKISNDRTWARLRYAAARAAAAGDAAGYAPCPPWPPSAAADAWMLGDDSAGDSWGAFVRVRAGDAGAWAARHPVWAVVLAAGPLVLLLARQARGGGGGWLWCGRSGACSTVAHARRVARIVHVSWAAWAGPRDLAKMRARSAALGALVAGALGASTSTGGSASPIEYIIVVMMENRSFDHLLGHLAATNPKVDGCLPGKCSNPTDPLTPGSPVVQVNNNAVDGGPVDPHHDFDSITQQVFGFKKPVANTTAPCLMNGFVANAAKGSEDFVMSAFNATNLPVLTTLANEFAVFDHWHCASPTPTNPNREFLMSGTAHGMIVNDLPDAGFPQQTHFAFLEARNVSWRIYYNDDPWMAPAFKDLRTPERLANNIVEMPAFFADLTAGTLPRYSLVEPRMASSATGPSNWQHPDNSVQAGEAFYSEIYTALRASPYWEKTLLIITFDEHGGFHDHVPTPSVGVPSPDGIAAPNGFQYDRLGVRVPTVMVSPWIAKGTTVGLPSAAQAPTPTSQFDATSIISTANKIFGIADNMTRRDAWAATFLDVVSGASGLRTDCPMALPAPPPLTAAALRAEMAMPLNDHHLDSLNLLCHLAAGAHPACASNAGAGRDAYLASLGAAAVEPVAWAAAVAFPHLAAAVAPLLRQEHFGAASAAMYAAYKASVGVGAGAGAVA